MVHFSGIAQSIVQGRVLASEWQRPMCLPATRSNLLSFSMFGSRIAAAENIARADCSLRFPVPAEIESDGRIHGPA